MKIISMTQNNINLSENTQIQLLNFIRKFQNVVFIGDDPILQTLMDCANDLNTQIDKEFIAYHKE